MRTLLQDFKYGFRSLAKQPSFTLIAIIMLSLGIGANTAIFSVVNGVLLHSLPVAEPDRYVALFESSQQRGITQISVAPSNYLALRGQQTAFEDVAAYTNQSFTLTDDNAPELLGGARVSANLFPLFRATPVLGRTFTPEEDKPGNERVVVLSYGLWQRLYNGSDKVIGKTMMIDGNPCAIVGVMPAEFSFPQRNTQLWMPTALDAERGMSGMGGRILGAVAKLKPGVKLETARAEMSLIAKRLTEANPSFNPDLGLTIVPLKDVVVGEKLRLTLLVLFGVVGFVLLIVCANVANLLLARAATREREMAIRVALGASRWRVVKLLLFESLIMTAAGSVLGLLFASWAVDVLVSLSPDNVLGNWRITFDARVVGFTVALTLLTSLFFSLVPALRYSRLNLNEKLKESNRSATSGSARNRLRSALVVAEVALSLVLLIGAGLMVKSFSRLLAVDPGYEPNNLMTFQLSLPESRYADGQPVVAFYQQISERLSKLPGVQSVGATNALPTSGLGGVRPFLIEGKPQPEPGKEAVVQYRLVSPDYFRTMNIKVMRGREFTAQDNDKAPGVVVINQSLANKYFPNENPVGKRVTLGGYADIWGEVVGVVNDVHHWGAGEDAGPEMYWSYSQSWIRGATLNRLRRSLTVVVRTSGKPEDLSNIVRSEVAALDKTLPVSNLKSMEERMGASLSGPRFNALLISIFASLALLLAAIGLYGVMSYSFSQRTNEIGIRMALGAQTGDVLKMVLKQGMTLALIGVGIGLIAAFALTRLIEKLLFGVSATDPLTFFVIALSLAIVSLLACYIPARRATKVDPITALRYE